MCMEDVRIARSQTVRSIQSGGAGTAAVTYQPWPNRTRFVISGAFSDGAGYIVPMTFQVYMGDLPITTDKLLLTAYEYGPTIVDIDTFGNAVAGPITIAADVSGLGTRWSIVEMELTTPPGQGQPFTTDNAWR